MKIAIIGSGISGLTSAYYLNQNHDVTVFEKDDRLGGHTATKNIELKGESFAIDTGFIVFNDWTYPNFIRLMAEIGAPWRDSEMSFSVSCQRTGLEWAGSSISSIFAQRKNIFSWYFLKMLKDIARFNKQAPLDLEQGNIAADTPLETYLKDNNYSEGFIKHYLIPMGAAIWSTSYEDMQKFPVQFFVKFFKNHGLLSITNRPVWKTIKGGSSAYIEPLIESFKSSIKLNSNITSVKRISREGSVAGSESVLLNVNGEDQAFDHVIFCCHSDQALELLSDSTQTEQEILNAIPYEDNEVVLHTDSSLLPNSPLARSSWNYTLGKTDGEKATLTYDMNTLQGINSKYDFLVSLNQSEKIDKSKILGKYNYSHPQFSLQGVAAQARWSEINQNNTWFCGAYWRNGFHEDGVYTALRVVNAIQGENENTTLLDGKARSSDLQKANG